MTREDWDKIREASGLLGLGEKASLAEIKKAFRRLSKKHHPDVKDAPDREDGHVEMHRLTEAYQTLLQYCAAFRFPLIPGDDEQPEGEDWWFERFGQDHHWGRGCMPKEEDD